MTATKVESIGCCLMSETSAVSFVIPFPVNRRNAKRKLVSPFPVFLSNTDVPIWQEFFPTIIFYIKLLSSYATDIKNREEIFFILLFTESLLYF